MSEYDDAFDERSLVALLGIMLRAEETTPPIKRVEELSTGGILSLQPGLSIEFADGSRFTIRVSQTHKPNR